MIKKIKLCSKKGELLMEEVVRIIIGVIGILALLYLALSLYQIFMKQTELEKARTGLTNIIGKIGEVENSGGTIEYLLLSPVDWALTGWPYKQYTPEFCAAQAWEKCICLCDMSLSWYEKANWNNYGPEAMSKRCSENRICKEIPKNAEIKKLQVNPKSDSFFSVFDSNLRPIYIGGMKPAIGSFKGDLLIAYNKTTSTLSINVKEI